MGRTSVNRDWINITQSSIKLLTYDRLRCGMTQGTLGKTYWAWRGRVPCTVKCRWQKWTRIWRRKGREGGGRRRKKKNWVEDRGRGGMERHNRENKNQRGLLWSCLPPQYFTIGIWEEQWRWIQCESIILHHWKFFEAQLDNALVFQSVTHVSNTGHDCIVYLTVMFTVSPQARNELGCTSYTGWFMTCGHYSRRWFLGLCDQKS